MISLIVPIYIDPGSGSTLIQLLIAGILGSFVLIKLYWKRIVSRFNRSKDEKSEKPSNDENI